MQVHWIWHGETALPRNVSHASLSNSVHCFKGNTSRCLSQWNQYAITRLHCIQPFSVDHMTPRYHKNTVSINSMTRDCQVALRAEKLMRLWNNIIYSRTKQHDAYTKPEETSKAGNVDITTSRSLVDHTKSQHKS